MCKKYRSIATLIHQSSISRNPSIIIYQSIITHQSSSSIATSIHLSSSINHHHLPIIHQSPFLSIKHHPSIATFIHQFSPSISFIYRFRILLITSKCDSLQVGTFADLYIRLLDLFLFCKQHALNIIINFRILYLVLLLGSNFFRFVRGNGIFFSTLLRLNME